MMRRPDPNRLWSSTWYPGGLTLGTFGVFGWLFVHALCLMPDRALLWGSGALVAPVAYADGLVNNFFFLLVYNPAWAESIFFLHLTSALTALFRFRGVGAFRLTAWLSGLMLYFAAYPAFNSGFLLVLLLALYTVVVSPASRTWWRTLLNNAAWLAVLAQLVLVYAAASWFKLSGTMWPQGTALYYALHIDYLCNPFFVGAGLKKSLPLLTALTYAALAYQVLFPLIILFSRWRTLWLLAGVGFHLGVAVLLDLPDFATAMLCAYLFFVPETFARRLLRKTIRIGQTHKTHIPPAL